MNKLLVKKSLVVDENEMPVDTSVVYSQEFLNVVNSRASDIQGKSDYINEIFLYFFIPLLEKSSFIKNSNIQNIEIDGGVDREVLIWFEAAKQNGLGFSNFKKLVFYLRAFYLLVTAVVATVTFSFILPVYTLLKFDSYNEVPKKFKAFCVIRSPAACSKMIFLRPQGVEFFCDDMVYEPYDALSIFRAPVVTRLLGVLFVPVYGVRDFLAIFYDAKKMLGFLLACDVVAYYVKRTPHKVNFEFYLDRLFKSNKSAHFYTGNKEDRFAILEKRLCSKYGLKCLCVPHGLEYAYKLPAGLVGDVFYCNSEFAKKYLEKLYRGANTKFIFDKSFVTKMLAKNRTYSEEKRVVFFPESREIDKNLDIIKNLKIWGGEFYIKLHVKDCIENYLPYINKNMLIQDFDDAISNNICLARKSTVLIEAVYNNSTPIAVLVDPKDKTYVELMFPSLNDKSILTVYSFGQLKRLLTKLEAM